VTISLCTNRETNYCIYIIKLISAKCPAESNDTWWACVLERSATALYCPLTPLGPVRSGNLWARLLTIICLRLETTAQFLPTVRTILWHYKFSHETSSLSITGATLRSGLLQLISIIVLCINRELFKLQDMHDRERPLYRSRKHSILRIWSGGRLESHGSIRVTLFALCRWLAVHLSTAVHTGNVCIKRHSLIFTTSTVAEHCGSIEDSSPKNSLETSSILQFLSQKTIKIVYLNLASEVNCQLQCAAMSSLMASGLLKLKLRGCVKL